VAVVDRVMEALRIGTGFLWVAGWAIMMGLIITSWVQSFVSKERIARLLGEERLGALVKATGFGAASSGCSFGATAIGKGLFKQGAHPVNVLAFMFASTNLIIELGLMILILFGWEFLVAELLGGLVLIAIMAVLVHFTLPVELFERARQSLAHSDHEHGISEDPSCGKEGSDEYTLTVEGKVLRFCSAGCLETYQERLAARGDWRQMIGSWGGWYRLASQYRMEWSMIYKDVIAGFLISGFVIVFVPQSVWNALFLHGGGLFASAENAVMGVAIAVLSFVGSIGNVPFAMALWGGGVSFAGVIAFVYSDLITIPVLNVYRKYYGLRVMWYIFAVFFVTMAASGFLMEELFKALSIIPNVVEGQGAAEQSYFKLDYTFYLNLIAFGISAFLYWVYRKGLGAPSSHRDPICGMPTGEGGPSTTIEGHEYYFCSPHCLQEFNKEPARYVGAHG